MGTQVQCKTYFPGSYSMRDLNTDAENNWSPCYEDKILSGRLYEGFVLRPLSGYSEYDKKMLKQIMLEHEAIFRSQVYELHRLYRIQKDLMNEFQKKGLYRYLVQADTSQSNSFSSQRPSEGTKRIWQMPHLPVVRTSCNTTPIADTDDKSSSPLNLFKGSSIQSDQVPTGNGALQKDSDIQGSKLKKIPKRMFDLQLPADLYINSEDADRIEKENVAESSFRYTVPSNKIYNADSMNGMELTLRVGECLSHQKDSCKSDPLQQNGLPADTLADLNKPVGQIFHEISAGSASTNIHSPRTIHEARGQQLPMSSNMSFLGGLQSIIFEDRHNVGGSCSNFSYAAREKRRQDWRIHNIEAGESGPNVSFFRSGFHNKNLPISSEHIQLHPANSQEVVLPNKVDSCFGQKPALGIEISARTPCLAMFNSSGPSAPGTPSLFPISPNLDYTCTTPLVPASKKRLNSIRDMVQALPCFNGSVEVNVQSKRSNTTIQGSSSACDTWQHNGDLRPHLKLGNEGSSYPDGFHHNFKVNSNLAPFSELNLHGKGDSSAFWNGEGHGPQKCFKSLQCTYNKSATDTCLKQALPNGSPDGFTTQQDVGVNAVEGEYHVSSSGISWLTRKPASNEIGDGKKCASQMEFGFSLGYPKQLSTSNAVDPKWEWRPEKEKGLSLCNFQDFPSASQFGNIVPSNEVHDNSTCKRILGFPILDKIHQNAICFPSYREKSVTDDNKDDDKDREKDGVSCTELTPDIKSPSSETQVHVSHLDLKGKRLNNLINLNSTYMDNPYSTEISPEGEVEVPSQFTMPSVCGKGASTIGLEDLVASHSEVNILPLEESVLPSKIDGSQDTECSQEALEAAENIIQMSSDKCSSFSGITHGQAPPALSDSLRWFAEAVVSKVACTPTMRGGDGCIESSKDGLDHFELMTLKLEEIKVHEYRLRPRESDIQEDEKGAASLLLPRPRRGQARGRRQRRDFQKDILPSLTSLSRHEVTEDLQTIGGLMKTSGSSWQMGLTRRNTGRNGLHSQARGRRRPRNLAATAAEIHVSPPLLQPTNAELEVDARTVICWGRTTRRCRRRILT